MFIAYLDLPEIAWSIHHGFHWLPSYKSQFLGISPWFSPNFPKISPKISHDFSRFPLISPDFPRIFPWFPKISHDFPMIFPRILPCLAGFFPAEIRGPPSPQARFDPGSTLVLRSARAETCYGQLRLELGRPGRAMVTGHVKEMLAIEIDGFPIKDGDFP